MKKYFKLIAMAGLACFVAASCTKDSPENPTPASLTAPTLTASPASVVVSEGSEDIALSFSWTDVAAEGITPVYSFQVTKQGDNEFSAGTAFDCPGTEKKFSHAELASLAGEIGASIDEGFNLIARVRVTAKDNKDIAAVLSNVVSVAVSKEQYPIQNIYPIGNGTPYGWSLDKTEAMEKSGSTFTWTGHIYANAEFKFLLQNDGWWPGIVNKTDDAYKYEPVLGFSDAADKKFKVDKEGKYTITIDASNTNDLKMNVQFIDDDIQKLVVEHLYILGGATKTGWSLDAMEEFEKNGNIFTWEGSLTEGGEFRFPMQRDWWPCLMIAMDGETLVKGVSDDEKTGYAVDETAIYKIVCDIDNMKVSINKTGDIAPAEFPTVYMCGDATPYGWSSVMSEESQLVPEDMGNVNVLSWTGELKASGSFKFLTTSDWVPSYNRDADASDYWTLVYRENYDQPDEKFQVSEDGNYKVVVDLDAMKVTCTKVGGDDFDYTPGADYLAADNIWKPADSSHSIEWYYNPTWSGEMTPPEVSFKESTYSFTNEVACSGGSWSAQMWIIPSAEIKLDMSKTYTFKATMCVSNDTPVFVKGYTKGVDWPEYFETPNETRIVLKAGEVTEVKVESFVPGIDTPLNLLFDFGGIPADTKVYIKDITLTED